MNSSQLTENTLYVMGSEWLNHLKEESKSIVITRCIPKECLLEITMKNRGNLKSSTLLRTPVLTVSLTLAGSAIFSDYSLCVVTS